MTLVRDHRRLEYVNYLIKRKATGDLATLAKKNNLSKRGMSDFLNQMKELGADIRYDRKKKTYYYAEEGEITRCFFIKYGEVLSKDQASKIGHPHELCFSEKATFIPCEKMI